MEPKSHGNIPPSTEWRAPLESQSFFPLTAFVVSVSNLAFDTYQFKTRINNVVSAEFDGHEFRSKGIAYEDYARMHTQQVKLHASRRNSTPGWAFDDAKLREIILRCLEVRAGLRRPQPGTHAQRLARAQEVLASFMRQELTTRIDELCAKYVAAKRAGNFARERALSQKIEETDTQLRLIYQAPQVLAGVVYYYWRCGLDSVAVGHQLGIKPPHVRGLLWRIGRVAGLLGYGEGENPQQNVAG
jgi:hypothetical protein